MSDEWTDDDCPQCRKAFTYLLRAHVRHQDGRHSQAPMLVFADADYEDGDGSTGLHGDAKRANEPAIVFVRADQFLDAQTRIEALEARVAAADKLAEAVTHEREMVCQDFGMQQDASQAVDEALAAYEATKEQSE